MRGKHQTTYLPVTQGKYPWVGKNWIPNRWKELTTSPVKTTVFLFFSCQDNHCVSHSQAFNLNNSQRFDVRVQDRVDTGTNNDQLRLALIKTQDLTDTAPAYLTIDTRPDRRDDTTHQLEPFTLFADCLSTQRLKQLQVCV